MFEKRIFSNDFVSGDFILSDSEKLYEQNKNKLGDSWFYTDNKISYDLNSEGFRAPRFDMVSWRKTIAVFGCSYVFGTGLPESHTISGRINLKTNHDVINLGVEGLSNYGILYNVTQFKKKYNPKICIIFNEKISLLNFRNSNLNNFKNSILNLVNNSPEISAKDLQQQMSNEGFTVQINKFMQSNYPTRLNLDPNQLNEENMCIIFEELLSLLNFRNI